MTTFPTFIRSPRDRTEEIIIVATASIVVCLLAGPLTFGLTLGLYLWLKKHKKAQKQIVVLITLAVLSLPLLYILLPLAWQRYIDLLASVFQQGDVQPTTIEYLVPIWFLTLPLSPGLVLMYELWKKLRPQSIEEREIAQRQRIEQAQYQLSVYP